MKFNGMILWAIQLLAAVMFCGCTAVPQPRTVYKPPLTEGGELYFYLQPLPQEMLPLRFVISDVSAVSEQGERIALLNTRLDIRGGQLSGVQKRLLLAVLPAGRYKGISLTIEEAAIANESGEMNLRPPAEPFQLQLDFSILRGRSLALFLFLSHEFLVTDGSRFTPRFVLGRPTLPPRNLLGFISSTDENIVTVFNKKTMEVVQVIHTGVGPRGLALDQRRGLLYVAAAGADTIEVISMNGMEIIGRIRQHFGDEPVELALTPDGRTLLSANQGSSTVSIIDTRSLLEHARYAIDPDPVWIVAGRDGQRAYVLHGLSSTISVVDISGLSLLPSAAIDESPLRGALSRDGQVIYVATQFTTDLLVFDINSFIVIGRIFVGAGSTSVTVDPKSNLVYVGKKSGEIVVVDPASGMFIDSFPVERNTGYMIIDGEENALLVLSESANKLQKINLVSKRKRAAMETERGSYAVAVMGGL